MERTRRQFMRDFGVAMAALMLAGCRPLNIRFPWTGDEDDWDKVRAAWAGLEQLASDSRDYDLGEDTRERLIGNHRAALDSLVSAGHLSSATADDLHAAFYGAAQHVWRANAPITCYVPAPYPDYGVSSSSDLARQADILLEMADRSGIDPATVAEAQASIERDMAFLALSTEDEEALMETLHQAAAGGEPYPSLSELDLSIPRESAEAALILVDLLLGKK